MTGGCVSSKINIQYSESNIIFGISRCCCDKKYSFFGLDKNEAENLVKRLQHIEQMTWKQFSSLDRDLGITPEIPDSKTFNMIDNQNSSETKLMERYYFHFRVKNRDLFRVFGYQYKNIFYITHLDPKGELHQH